MLSPTTVLGRSNKGGAAAAAAIMFISAYVHSAILVSSSSLLFPAVGAVQVGSAQRRSSSDESSLRRRRGRAPTSPASQSRYGVVGQHQPEQRPSLETHITVVRPLVGGRTYEKYEIPASDLIGREDDEENELAFIYVTQLNQALNDMRNKRWQDVDARKLPTITPTLPNGSWEHVPSAKEALCASDLPPFAQYRINFGTDRKMTSLGKSPFVGPIGARRVYYQPWDMIPVWKRTPGLFEIELRIAGMTKEQEKIQNKRRQLEENLLRAVRDKRKSGKDAELGAASAAVAVGVPTLGGLLLGSPYCCTSPETLGSAYLLSIPVTGAACGGLDWCIANARQQSLCEELAQLDKKQDEDEAKPLLTRGVPAVPPRQEQRSAAPRQHQMQTLMPLP